jgi:hypothetical protein
MNEYFVSYYYTTQENNQGIGRQIATTTAKKLSTMILGEIEEKIKEANNFKELVIINFIKL